MEQSIPKGKSISFSSNSKSSADSLDDIMMIQSTKPKLHSRHKQRDEEGRPKTPVIVVGYPNGYPNGLNLFGNRDTDKIMSDGRGKVEPHDIQKSTKLPDLPKNYNSKSRRKDETKSLILMALEKKVSDKVKELIKKNPTGAPSSIQPTREKEVTKSKESTEYELRYGKFSTGVNDILNEGSKSSSVNRRRTEHSLSSLRDSEGKQRSPVAPWRDLSVFQSPTEHRKKTFNNFYMMSPEPPKTPNQAQSHTVNLSGPTKSKELLKQESKGVKFPLARTSSQELSFQNEILRSQRGGSMSKRKLLASLGKSATGLSYASRMRNSVTVNKTPSMILLSAQQRQRREKASTQQLEGSLTGPAPTPKKSLVTVTGSKGRNSRRDPSGHIPIPPSKRLEQARLMNHIIHDYIQSQNMKAREKYSYPLYQSGQSRHQGSPTKRNQFQAQRPKVLKQQHLPPVCIPGPRRENIYIGHYDGSDDSDADVKEKVEEVKKERAEEESKEATKDLVHID